MSEQWPPAGAELAASFHVIGRPRPAGSKNAIPLGKRVGGRFIPYTHEDGRPKISVKDSSGTEGENWRADIQRAFVDGLERTFKLLDGPIAVRVTFFIRRPKGHYGTGRNDGVLKVSAPARPHTSELADGTKLARALEDALNELAWADDRRVCEMWWSREYGERAGARVEIYTLPETISDTQPQLDALSLLDPPRSMSYPVGDDYGNEEHEDASVAAV